MKSTKLGWLGLATMMILSGCGVDRMISSNKASDESSRNQQSAHTVTNQLSNDYYRALVIDGKYQSSKSRGVTLGLNSGYNLKNFELGLIDLSKKNYPTSQYYFREGQIIDTETATKWVGRNSSANKDGLNPADNGQSGDARAPYYLSQILEQDYMIQTENNYELGGISIGLAMNSVDYYGDSQQKISDTDIAAQAKEMANKILVRLRQNDDLKTIPIVFGVFKQAEEDSIAGGTFILSATSVEGTEVTNWTSLNNRQVTLPLIEGDPTEESVAFENFRSEVQNFFPNLSGVTATVSYQDGLAKRMVISVMTQFYGESEIVALTQHVTDTANRFLPNNVPVEVKISSINGVEAFLLQDRQKGVFTYHIFD